MTNEEKIAELINIRDKYNYTLAPREVFDDAIKALEAQLTDLTAEEKEIIDAIHKMGLFRTNYANDKVSKVVSKIIKAYEAQPTDADCISRQAVIDLTWDWENFKNITRCDGLDTLRQMRIKIEALPSVTPQRPKGKWIYEMKVMNNPYTYKCSVCKGWEKDKTKYCPNCGAEMETE